MITKRFNIDREANKKATVEQLQSYHNSIAKRMRKKIEANATEKKKREQKRSEHKKKNLTTPICVFTPYLAMERD
jgi:hypothetical protein